MQRVIGVSTDTINVPNEHKHITSVRCIDATRNVAAAGSKLLVSEQAPEVIELTVGEVFQRMTDGEGFWVHYDAEDRERFLHIHECPVCETFPYLCDDTTFLPDDDEED